MSFSAEDAQHAEDEYMQKGEEMVMNAPDDLLLRLGIRNLLKELIGCRGDGQLLIDYVDDFMEKLRAAS